MTGARIDDVVDRFLDAAVVVLATWTVVYHVFLVLDLGSDLALAVEAVLLVAVALVSVSTGSTDVTTGSMVSTGSTGVTTGSAGVTTGSMVSTGSTDAPRRSSLSRPSRPPSYVVLAAAVVAAVGMALDVPWGFVWVSWLVAAVAGVVAVAPRAVREPGTTRPAADVRGSWFAVACALGLAAFSTVTLRPNPDDLYYVNLSQWVAAHGDFPTRDTIFADLVYPMSNWPPLASYDGLTGALAHVLGVRAGDISYVVVPPVLTALAVLALWRLLRAWRVRHVALALGFALLFLLADGTSSYGPPGNLFLTRLWQGKVILLCLLVPTLLTYALEHVERPTRRTLVRLATGGAAAVACSTTAIFLLPLLALAGAAPLVRRAPRSAVAGFAALAAYPVAAGVATLALGGRSADDFGERRQYRFDPAWFGHAVFLTDLLALVAVLAVLAGCLVVPHPAARLTTALLVTATGVTFVPGFTRLTYDVVGLGPTLWRITWGCTVAALLGATVSFLWSRAPAPRVAIGGAALLALSLAAFGRPIWWSDTSTDLVAPFHWQRSADARHVVDWIIDRDRPDQRVLAPDGLSITLAVTTTAVKTVTPRDYYLSYLRDEPGFHYDDRLLLTGFANDVPDRREDVYSSLTALDVGVACVYRTDARGIALLQAAGYRGGITSRSYRCLTST